MPVLTDLLPTSFADEEPQAVLFFSGAGISVDPPTSGPIGDQLANRALEHAFEPRTAETIEGYYRQLCVRRTRPRLETVLEVARRVHGEKLLLDLLSDLNAPSNDLHALFAWHAAAGGRHVTANFDTCIERAPTSMVPEVFHFHGSLSGGQLGATLAAIERGFDEATRAGLDSRLLAEDVRLLVFVGYSGSDFFDVDPYLRSLARGALDGRKVLWISHAADLSVPVEDRPQLEWLARAGAETREVRGPTRALLNEFARRWDRPVLGPGSPSTPHWAPMTTPADDARQRASTELYALMGLHRELDRRLPIDTDMQELLGQTRWAQGRYREAGRAWQVGLRDASPAVRAERKGAVLWIRGDYDRARNVLVAALEDASASLEARLRLAETLARVFEHARRFPDSRRVASPELRAFLLERLPDPKELAMRGEPLGVHLRSRVSSVRRVLGAELQDDDDPIESFGQFEALNAQLNYRHSLLRERAERAIVAANDFRQQRRDFSTIGAHGDAARTVLLGGLGPFSPREVLTALMTLDVNWRQRWWLGAASALGGARRWMRRCTYRRSRESDPGRELGRRRKQPTDASEPCSEWDRGDVRPDPTAGSFRRRGDRQLRQPLDD